MIKAPRPIYCPALRMKAGELDGLRRLSRDVAGLVLPRLIIPPKGEREASQPTLIEVEEVPDIGEALLANWRQWPVLIDTTYIMGEYGRDRAGIWLPEMFRRARSRGVRAIPLANLFDLNAIGAQAFRPAIAVQELIKLAICVPYDELLEPGFSSTLHLALDRIGLPCADCAVIVDFGGSEFGDPNIVAPIIRAAVEAAQDLGPWQQVIFQGTHYPETNPAKHGAVEMWPRNEWQAWKLAVKFDPTTADYMTFGDYAADSAKMSFEASKAPAIRHIRYATATHWRIQRAIENGSDAQRMRGVYKAIVECEEFPGDGFSQADDFIARAATDPSAPPGNSTTWRQLNTTHHITQTVTDIARVRGIVMVRAPEKELLAQSSLFD